MTFTGELNKLGFEDDLTAILAEKPAKSTPKSPYHGAYELPIAIGKPR